MTNSALIVVVDRLGAGCLGPYGNTWISTPNFNALAARSTLLDNCLADSPEVSQAYRGYWDGRHVLEDNAQAGSAALLSSLASTGVQTTLLTDDPQVANLSSSDYFTEKLLLDLEVPTASAGEIEETALAGLFAETVDVLQRQKAPFLLWVHARGLAAPWDAPLALRHRLADEDDPDPLEVIAVPAQRLPENFDPDELLGIVQAHAAQVMVLDACLGVLLEALEQLPQREQLLTIVTSPRGFPLGEHHIVGGGGVGQDREGNGQAQLHGELLHVPLLLSQGSGKGALLRSPALVQPPDVAATLHDWFQLEKFSPTRFARSLLPLTTSEIAEPSSAASRDRVVSNTDDQQSIRTPAWFLRTTSAVEQLYRKPDDRFERNEVARRCPHIVEQLLATLSSTNAALRAGSGNSLPALPEELREGLG